MMVVGEEDEWYRPRQGQKSMCSALGKGLGYLAKYVPACIGCVKVGLERVEELSSWIATHRFGSIKSVKSAI